MIYQHPLAYLIGIEGLALLRSFAGEHDEAFTWARLAEIESLLARREAFGGGTQAAAVSTTVGYRGWAAHYDEQRNGLIDVEQPIVRRILETLPVGTALDAACGTGRHAEFLAAQGHHVIGVDSSVEMLAGARQKLPGLEFLEGDLHALPVPDNSVDVLVCALALTHVPDLSPVFEEFVRVLKPGGHLVTSDSRGLVGDIGLPLVGSKTRDDEWGYMPAWTRLTSEYLSVALPLGLQVRACVEPRWSTQLVNDDGSSATDGAPAPPCHPDEPPNIWALHQFAVDAANAAYAGKPIALVWHFQLTG